MPIGGCQSFSIFLNKNAVIAFLSVFCYNMGKYTERVDLMASKPLHILVVATWLPGRYDKLMGIYHKHFCEALAQAGVKVGMLHIDRQPISQALRFPFMKKRYTVEEKGYRTHARRMLNRHRLSPHWQMKAYTRCLYRLYKAYEKKNGKPDVLHAQVLIPAGYATAMLGKRIGVPVLITEHASYFERFFKDWSAPYTKKTVESGAQITCVGNYMVELFAKLGVQAQVLPNTVDCSVFSGPKAEKTDSTIRFATVCALREGKGIEVAVQALSKLSKEEKLTDFTYTVIGNGDQSALYRAAAEQAGIADRTRFVGQKNHQQIAEILAHTDILLMPSDKETFAIPVIEAAAAGVPVVCTRCGGPEGFLTPDSAEFCGIQDADGMADAIMRMAARLPQIDEQKVRQVAAAFDRKAVAEKAIGYYKALLKN